MQYTSSVYLHTGSNCFVLGGSMLIVSQSVGSQTSVPGSWYGPSLGVIHTLNQCIQGKIAFTGSYDAGTDIITKSPGVPDDNLKYDANNKNLYFCFDPSGSFNLNNTSSNNNDINPTPINEYNNTTEPFLIEEGDEITVKYTIRTTQNIVYYQDFVVTGVPRTAGISSAIKDEFGYYYTKFKLSFAPSNVPNVKTPLDNIFAKINVYPDPQSITPSIQAIDGFQIKRRVNADDRVIIYQSPPPKSKGSLSPSGEGFIIPNDLTAVQKLNVQSLITQLRAKNSFPPDESTNNLNSRS